MKNQSMGRRRSKSAKSLTKEELPAPVKGKKKELSTRELEEAVYQLEVAITAAPREARERYLRNLDVLPPPEMGRRRPASAGKAQLTFAQARARRNQRLLHLAEFIVTFTLIAGICSALYKWYQMSH